MPCFSLWKVFLLVPNGLFLFVVLISLCVFLLVVKMEPSFSFHSGDFHQVFFSPPHVIGMLSAFFPFSSVSSGSWNVLSLFFAAFVDSPLIDVEFSVFQWPHPLFLRLGSDLLYRCAILPSLVSSNLVIRILTLDRRKLRVVVDASLEAIKSQRRTVIPGEGMPYPPSPTTGQPPSDASSAQLRGNLLIEVSLRSRASHPRFHPPIPLSSTATTLPVTGSEHPPFHHSQHARL